MGYACPVCEAPQTDGEHLANHLAFTAMLREDEHEEWLDDHVDDWEERSPGELAPDVTPYAPEIEAETVFDDTTGGHDHSGHDHGQAGHDRGRPEQLEDELAQHGGYGRDSITSLSGEDQQILDEAREMTRQMMDDGEDEPADEERGEASDEAADDTENE